jgi:transcriptional repressor of dcmA and dcmR
MKDDELLSIREAAVLLGVTETSLRRWTDSGRLACYRLGPKRERRFRRADLMAFMDRQPAAASVTGEPASRADLIGGVPVEQGTHLCSLYSSDAARTKLAVGFLADGLGPETEAFLFATKEVSAPIVEQLTGATRGEATKSLTVMDYRSTVAAQLETIETQFVAAVGRGCRSLRFVGIGAKSKLFQQKRFEEITSYELAYAKLTRRFPVVSLCQYDTRRYNGTQLCEVLKCHPDVFRYPSERLLF